MVCVPALRVVVVVRVALPVGSSATLGDCGWPSMVKVTRPVGKPVAGATGVTVAVKVTSWPKTEGAGAAARAVVVAAGLTCWLTLVLVALPRKLVSPA